MACASAALPCDGNDDVSAAREDQRRHLDPPEPVGDVERLQPGQPLGDDALIRLPDAFDDKVNQRARLRFRTVEQMEELVDEPIVPRQREPLEHPAGDRRAQGRMKTALRSVDHQPSETLRMVGRQLQGDRTAVRDSEDRGMTQPQAIDQSGEVLGRLRDISNLTRRPAQARPIPVIASQARQEDLEMPGEFSRQRPDQFPTPRQARDKD